MHLESTFILRKTTREIIIISLISLPQNITPEQFDPTSLTPDCISVDLRIVKPSEIKLYGSVLCLFIHLKVRTHTHTHTHDHLVCSLEVIIIPVAPVIYLLSTCYLPVIYLFPTCSLPTLPIIYLFPTCSTYYLPVLYLFSASIFRRTSLGRTRPLLT